MGTQDPFLKHSSLSDANTCQNDPDHEKTALKKLNRSYRALSEAVRARAESRTEDELLNRIAWLLKDTCEYRYVWIGYREHDTKRTVRPVAWSDNELERVQSLVVTWGDGPLGEGAVGTSIRTRKLALCENIPQNPNLAPLHEFARF